MPEMDGFEFMRQVAKREEWRSIPVVVLTAKDMDAEDYLRMSGYVEKIIQKGWSSREEQLREIRRLVGISGRNETSTKRSP